ncbi:hypothetical protein Tco_0739450 [Tanacetum coccineum]
MRTRSQARRLRQQQQQQQVPPNLVEPPKDTMADNRTMAELLQAPTEGYEDAIVVPEIVDCCPAITATTLRSSMVYLILFKTSNFLDMIKKTHMLTSDISTRSLLR